MIHKYRMGAALPDLSQKLILLWYGGPHSGGKMPLECYMQHVFTFLKDFTNSAEGRTYNVSSGK